MKLSTVLLISGFLILNIFPGSAIAQVEIGPEDIPTEAGSILPFYVLADPEGIEVDLGFGGEDREWDFTNYEFDDVEYDSLIAPEDAPNGEDFEDANRISLSSSGGIALNFGDSYQYELINDDGWFLLGTGSTMGFGNLNFPIIFPEPILLLPMPAEFDEEWDMTGSFAYGMEAPDTLMGGILDSVYIVIEVGGEAETDAWGTVRFPSGEVETIRQHVLLGVEIYAVGVAEILGRRMEFPIDLGLSIEPTHSYRWFAPDYGLLVEINSLPGEEEEDFELAASIRVRYLAPELIFQEESLEFGEIWQGGSNSETITIANNGVGDGRIMRIEPAEEFTEQISWDVELPYTISHEEETEITFRWQPEEYGELETEIEIFHNDPVLENPLVVSAHCTSLLRIEDGGSLNAQEFSLHQNFPNPFNSQTIITFNLNNSTETKLEIIDAAGRQIAVLAEGLFTSGQYDVTFEPDNLPIGIYLYRLSTGKSVLTRKMIYLK
ncbi:MAG: T9SS type A sorting domain-containing protein [Candidatus Hatepunaea meridiana]|nr:T9SS type A sorting domain-containing protein [Candidatus Hatepunaea meridiana]